MYPRNISYWAFLPGVVALGVLFFTLNYFPDRSVLEGICAAASRLSGFWENGPILGTNVVPEIKEIISAWSSILSSF